MSALDLTQDLEMSSEKGKKGRGELTLKEREDVIEYSKKNPGLGSRNITSFFKCGKTVKEYCRK